MGLFDKNTALVGMYVDRPREEGKWRRASRPDAIDWDWGEEESMQAREICFCDRLQNGKIDEERSAAYLIRVMMIIPIETRTQLTAVPLIIGGLTAIG